MAGSSLDLVTELLDLRPAEPGAPVAPGRTLLGTVAGRSGPRFLVPLGHRGAAPASCLAYLGLRPLKTRASRGLVGLGLRAGLDRVVTKGQVTADHGPGSLLAEVADVLGVDEVAVGVGLGVRDAVWKPTLQVFATDGEPLAFVKVGVGPVAAELVRTEAAALAAWGRHDDPRLVVPDLLAERTWRGHPLAVVAPLPTDVRRLPPGLPSAWPVRELDGPLVDRPLAGSPWWTARRAAVADAAAVAPRLATAAAEALDRIEARAGAVELPHGRAHGDWVPWNLARCHVGLVAWDWEYSEPGTPVGLDEVHGRYQQDHVVGGRPVAGALAAARAVADQPAVADAHVALLVARAARQAVLAGGATPRSDELVGSALETLR